MKPPDGEPGRVGRGAAPHERIRVLVVEDSGFMRGVLRHILTSDPQMEVVGVAADGLQAVEGVAALAPHVVTMDVEMPRADGLSAVARIMADRPTPILMFSSHTRDGSAAAIRALELGAVDFVPKPAGGADVALETLRETILGKVRMAARVRPIRTVGLTGEGRVREHSPRRSEPGRRPAATDACVVIAASTGGPAALLRLVPALPADFPAPVLIVQHMPAPYTTQLARELAARSALVVREAEAGERLAPGVVHVAPGSRDLTVTSGRLIGLGPTAGDGGSPSADLALASVARAAGAAGVAVVLTGMGTDGARGADAIARAGGRVLVQDEASSASWGMPRAALETGCVNAVVSLGELAETVVACLDDPAAYRDGLRHAS